MRRDSLMIVIALLGAALSGCGHRPVDTNTSDGSVPGDDALDHNLPSCAHPTGVRSTGQFTAGAFSTSNSQGTFTTNLSTIEATLWVKQSSASASIDLGRSSTLPVLPSQIDLAAPGAWATTVKYAWCNAMECRVDLHAGSQETSDRLSGWIALEGPADGQQLLFSNLTRLTACLRAEDGVGGKTNALTLNATFTRRK